MTAQEYILEKLRELKQSSENLTAPPKEKLESEVVRLVLSKKFRKYSASAGLIDHIKESVRFNIQNNQPIQFVYPHGGYKLWRLDEASEADFAELFSLMYYTKWLKPICEIYKPGVVLDFLVDDWIVEKNNVSREEIQSYLKSYQKVMDFLKPSQPKNLTMKITPVSKLFESEKVFWNSVDENLVKISAEGLPKISDAEKRTVELNVRPTDGSPDECWREKHIQLHKAYSITKNAPGYYKDHIEKIIVFTQSVASMFLAVGTTKSSVMKFWIGAGVLEPKKDEFMPTILSISQLEKIDYDWQDVSIDGLNGKNFHKVRILK